MYAKPFSVSAGLASAQNSNWYIFAGASAIPGGYTGYTYWNGNYIQAGGGGERGIGSRFTIRGEDAALISTAKTYGRSAAIASVGPGLHFFAREQRKFNFVGGRIGVCFR